VLPCRSGCAYKGEIPNDAHIRCLFAWSVGTEFPPQKWFAFPYNYDPTWGPDVCPHFSTVADPAKCQRADAMSDLLSLLANRFWK